MLEAERISGKILMVDHNQRLLPAHKKAREIVASGQLGRVITFQTKFCHKGPEYWSSVKSNATWFFKKERSEFGVAGDLGAHKFDLIHFLLDDEITEVHAMEGALHKKDEQGHPIEVCDNMISLLKTSKGVMGTASFSWTNYGHEENSTTLYCEQGVIHMFCNPDYDLEIVNMNGEPIRYRLGAIQTNDKQINSGVIDAFVQSIITNTPPPITGLDGLNVLRVIQAAAQSAQQGNKVIL
jgi:predicted dehydrogenase